MEAKRFEYQASMGRDGGIVAEAGAPVTLGEEWLPEHLVLVAIARCTLASLRFYARGASVEGSAEAAGTVTRREADGLYALVECEVLFDVEIDPAPAPDALPGLLARAERGCFVGNSLHAKPRYLWRVNGAHAEATS